MADGRHATYWKTSVSTITRQRIFWFSRNFVWRCKIWEYNDGSI